jgi:hypothetical protein
VFAEYLQKLHDELEENGVEFPIILWLDNHSSHLTIDVRLKARDLQIYLVTFYPNATFLLQPCDVALFRPFKVYWRQELMKLPEKSITKDNFLSKYFGCFGIFFDENNFFRCLIESRR